MKIVQPTLLVPEGIHFPVIAFAADSEAVAEYKERIGRDYRGKALQTLDVLSFEDGVVKGSNPFAAIAFASSSLALPGELEHAICEEEKLERMVEGMVEGYRRSKFRGICVDSGLVLRTEGDSYEPNDYIAENLFYQAKNRGITPTPETPAVISLRGLSVRANEQSTYGLVFVLGEDSQVFPAAEFAHTNHGKRFSRTDERGVPIFDEKGGRTLYTREGGLSRLYVDGDLDLGSGGYHLAYSYEDGRVVVKIAEGDAKK